MHQRQERRDIPTVESRTAGTDRLEHKSIDMSEVLFRFHSVNWVNSRSGCTIMTSSEQVAWSYCHVQDKLLRLFLRTNVHIVVKLVQQTAVEASAVPISGSTWRRRRVSSVRREVSTARSCVHELPIVSSSSTSPFNQFSTFRSSRSLPSSSISSSSSSSSLSTCCHCSSSLSLKRRHFHDQESGWLRLVVVTRYSRSTYSCSTLGPRLLLGWVTVCW